MKYFLSIIVFFGAIAGFAESKDISFKNDLGVSVFGDFKVEKYTYKNDKNFILNSQPGPGKYYYPPFFNGYGWRQWSIGATAFYKWRPIRATRNFYSQFGLGGEFNRFGDNDNFLFNGHIFLGYSIQIRKIGIDVFTGPSVKFAPRTRTYTGPIGFVLDPDYLNGLPTNLPTDVSQLPVETIKMYTGGVNWSAGVGARFKHVGVSLMYNQALTDFEHYWYPEKDNKIFKKNSFFNSMTVGIQYYF